MGAVSVDIHKKGREFKDFSLSNENVVKYLILYRYKLDVAYNSNINIDINYAGDIYEFNEELICLYASLDQLLNKINLKDKDKDFLTLTFKGYSISDINEIYKIPKRTAYDILSRIVEKIINENLSDWRNYINSNRKFYYNNNKYNK